MLLEPRLKPSILKTYKDNNSYLKLGTNWMGFLGRLIASNRFNLDLRMDLKVPIFVGKFCLKPEWLTSFVFSLNLRREGIVFF